jgi:hypothetical protein
MVKKGKWSVPGYRVGHQSKSSGSTFVEADKPYFCRRNSESSLSCRCAWKGYQDLSKHMQEIRNGGRGTGVWMPRSVGSWTTVPVPIQSEAGQPSLSAHPEASPSTQLEI